MQIFGDTFNLYIGIITPMILVLLALGFITGVIKVATQIEDRSLGFVLKFIAVFIVCYIFVGAWANRVAEFAKEIWGNFHYYMQS